MAETASKTHTALDALVYDGDVLTWAGRRVSDIAEELGHTPFYAYDRAAIARRVESLRKVLPAGMKIHYAMKANPMPDVVGFIAGAVDGLDVASAGELGVALATSARPADISFAGPGKQDAELGAAMDAGITINVESPLELERINGLASSKGIKPNVALRVNPSFELKAAGMKMGGRPSPFGIDAEQVPGLLEAIKGMSVRFVGFHIYSGSQNLRVPAIVDSIEKTVDLVIELAGTTDLPVTSVNIGGGLGIPYFPGDQPIPLDELQATYAGAYERLQAALGEAEVITELGRFLVGESGIYVCRVIDVKESRGSRFAVCDGGLHHHLAASGNFGQVIRRNYPVAAVRRSDNMEQVSVVGPLCTPLDLLADKVELPALEPGDLVAVLQSGAYGRTASPAAFLSHPDCEEILI